MTDQSSTSPRLRVTYSDGTLPGGTLPGGGARLSGAGASDTGCLGGPPPRDTLGAAAKCRSARPARRTSAAAFFGDLPEDDDPLLGFAPYEHRAPRRNSITPERQRMFIAALAATGIVTQAARAIGASLEALYRLRHMNGAQGFSAAWDQAIDRGMLRLQDCALERAIKGEERPLVSQGKVVATYVKYDTTAMMFLLRQRMAARFGEDRRGRDPQPGSPLYQRIIADYHSRQPSSEEIIDSINRKIETIKTRRLAHAASQAAKAEAEARDEVRSDGESGA